MFKSVRMLAGICAATAAILLAPPALAQDVVVNGGFEGGTAPWIAGSSWGNSVVTPRTGTMAAATGCAPPSCLSAGSSGRLVQDVVTTPGTTYTLTFWYRMSSAADTPVELQALLSNGVPTSGGAGTCTGNCVFQTQTAVNTYTQVTRTFVATSASTRITFLGRNDPAFLSLDDVSFVAEPPAPVPTMSEWAMILLGLMLAGGAMLMIQRRQMAA